VPFYPVTQQGSQPCCGKECLMESGYGQEVTNVELCLLQQLLTIVTLKLFSSRYPITFPSYIHKFLQLANIYWVLSKETDTFGGTVNTRYTEQIRDKGREFDKI
jgi:hypothetical protein